MKIQICSCFFHKLQGLSSVSYTHLGGGTYSFQNGSNAFSARSSAGRNVYAGKKSGTSGFWKAQVRNVFMKKKRIVGEEKQVCSSFLKSIENNMGSFIEEMQMEEIEKAAEIIPVSYTHLDVYKRQIFRNQEQKLFFFRIRQGNFLSRLSRSGK